MKEPQKKLHKCHSCKHKKMCEWTYNPYLHEYQEGDWDKKHWFCDECLEQMSWDI
jgi:hypothetical protein